jgi:RsiW-degrading membrane proteinase PrsW (M82 family)
VGFGFAALESSGYALASLFVVYQHRLYLSLDSVVVTEFSRGVLGAFILVALLHAIFDSLSSVAGYLLIAVVGLLPLIIMWRRGKREDVVAPASYFR